jgi:hypothetical protein
LLASGPFQDYSQRSGIAGVERELVIAYLLHCLEVIRPAEGASRTRELVEALATRWYGA